MWIEESSHLKQVRLSSNCLIRCNDNNMIQQRQKARATGFSSLWVVNSIISLNTYYSSQTHTASQDGWKYLWCRAKKGHATFRPSGLWRGSFYLLALWALKCNIYIKMCNLSWKFHFFQLGLKKWSNAQRKMKNFEKFSIIGGGGCQPDDEIFF